MVIGVISDIHSYHNKIELPKMDMLIVAGDFTAQGKPKEVKKFNLWLGRTNIEHIIVCGGNHEKYFDNELSLSEKKEAMSNSIYLEDESVTINGIKFWCAPWVSAFCGMGFNKSEKQRLDLFSNIPKDTDILVTHTPALGILDVVNNVYSDYRDFNTGCAQLKSIIEKRPNLKMHVFGHIHEQYGQCVANGIIRVNASVCNLSYKPVNKVQMFDINLETKEVKPLNEPSTILEDAIALMSRHIS
jgi:Icc-related predicted phosphoesterase